MFSGATGFNLDEFYLGFAKIYGCLFQFSAAHKSPLPKYNTINETARQYGSTTSGSTLALKKTFLTDVEKMVFVLIFSCVGTNFPEFSWFAVWLQPNIIQMLGWTALFALNPAVHVCIAASKKKYLSSTYFIAMSTKFASSFVFLHLVCARWIFFLGVFCCVNHIFVNTFQSVNHSNLTLKID